MQLSPVQYSSTSGGLGSRRQRLEKYCVLADAFTFKLTIVSRFMLIRSIIGALRVKLWIFCFAMSMGFVDSRRGMTFQRLLLVRRFRVEPWAVPSSTFA
jgi:hypothetical protein